jgi:hypothetical protein
VAVPQSCAASTSALMPACCLFSTSLQRQPTPQYVKPITTAMMAMMYSYLTQHRDSGKSGQKGWEAEDETDGVETGASAELSCRVWG